MKRQIKEKEREREKATECIRQKIAVESGWEEIIAFNKMKIENILPNYVWLLLCGVYFNRSI